MLNPYFSDTLESLIGYSIGIFSSDGTLIKGCLADVKEDYLILQNKEGDFFYYHLHQIKSIAKNTKDLKINAMNDDYLQAEKLQGILEHCKQQWVTINCHNNQLVTGYLSDVFEDHIILISSEEKIIMQTFHISNVFPGFYENSNSIATDNSNEKETSSRSQAEAASEVQQEFNEEKNQEEHSADAKTHPDPTVSNEMEVQSRLHEEEMEVQSQFHEEEMKVQSQLHKEEMEVRSQFHEEEMKVQSQFHEEKAEMIEESTDHEEEFLPTGPQEKDVQERSSIKIQPSTNIHGSLEEPQEENQSGREKETDWIDCDSVDKNPHLRLSIDTKSSSSLPKHEKSRKNSVSNSKTSCDCSINSSTLGKYFFRKNQSNKRVCINKKVMKQADAEEKQIEKPAAFPNVEDRQIYVKTILTQEEEEKILESQYYSLMKQAEKNYMSLRKKRLARESLK